MNFVAINLAHDIIIGRRTVGEAREEYTRLYDAYKNGEKPPYTQAFQFTMPALRDRGFVVIREAARS